MILINSSLCSAEFNAAFEALKSGSGIRKAEWPKGQYLTMDLNGSIRVVRVGCTTTPGWAGPSSYESDSTDWEVVAP